MKPRFYWAACAVLLAVCSPEPAAEKTVSAASQTASTSAATLTVPTARVMPLCRRNPERVAVYDWAALDTLTELGVNVGATTAPVRVDYLQPAFDKAATVGDAVYEPDYEVLHRYNPQLVITGGPGAEAYEQLAKKRDHHRPDGGQRQYPHQRREADGNPGADFRQGSARGGIEGAD